MAKNTEPCAFCKNEIKEGEESALVGPKLDSACTKCLNKMDKELIECPECGIFRARLSEECECLLCGTPSQCG